jgi:hypothetical protein
MKIKRNKLIGMVLAVFVAASVYRTYCINNKNYNKEVDKGPPIVYQIDRYPYGLQFATTQYQFGIGQYRDRMLQDELGVGQYHVKVRHRHCRIGRQHSTDVIGKDTFNNIYKNGHYDGFVIAASKEYKVPAELIRAVINAESKGNPNARSSEGALGLMQLMPGTAKKLGVKRPFDPKDNIMGGTKYLGQMLEMYGGNTNKALAAYSAGSHNVNKHGWKRYFKYVKSVKNKMKS